MKLNEINIRDPFILPYQGKYYMYGTRGPSCWGECDGFDVYISDDLVNWSDPIEVFHKPDGFWADRNYWAPEVHLYNGRFYAFISFKSLDRCRGTQILVSDKPEGPFQLHSDGPVTPSDWECLDGSLYVDKDNQPYMIFCHEWTQVADGEICAIKLSHDLKKPISQTILLFKASEPDWTREIKGGPNYCTDGPYMYYLEEDSNDPKATRPLLMLWSSFGDQGYGLTIARSNSGEITGPWEHDSKPLYEKDGGHGMIFKTFEGQLYLALHTPNEPLKERPIFIPILEKEDDLVLADPS